MSIHVDLNRHRPTVWKSLNPYADGRKWTIACRCGFWERRDNWHHAMILALVHSEDLL